MVFLFRHLLGGRFGSGSSDSDVARFTLMSDLSGNSGGGSTGSGSMCCTISLVDDVSSLPGVIGCEGLLVMLPPPPPVPILPPPPAEIGLSNMCCGMSRIL